MPTNLLKKYNDLLELKYFSETQRIFSLRGIFDRDIQEDNNLSFKCKKLRPIKNDGPSSMDTLFDHLIYSATIEKGIKKRDCFDFKRAERLHWIKNHILEKSKSNVDVFSYLDRNKNDRKDIIRTYIYDFIEQYVIILEPQRSDLDYYLLTAYKLDKDKGGIKQIEKKRKNRLPRIY